MARALQLSFGCQTADDKNLQFFKRPGKIVKILVSTLLSVISVKEPQLSSSLTTRSWSNILKIYTKLTYTGNLI